MTDATRPDRRIFSIGHSNHDLETFLDLLKRHHIEVVVDVRSSPYAKYATQFNMDPLRTAVIGAGMKYLFLGEAIGGHPAVAAFYDVEGHVLYERVAQSPEFREGIDRLERGALEYRVAIMCAEENPSSCHRRLLIGRVLAADGIALDHIRGDGRVQTEDDLVLEETGGQGDLFADIEGSDPWKRSTQSVSPNGPRPTSSKP